MELEVSLPPEYPKPIFVVADYLIETFREAFGDAAVIVPISETYLPVSADAQRVKP